jgi:glycosyltransferase involved in cell wall biosynthesis
LKVVQVSPRVQAQGGIEALLERHRALPGRSVFVALFDRRPQPRENYTNLNFTWRTPLGRMRREFASVLAPHAGAVVIYHNAWGLPFLHGGDAAARRLAFCHGMPAFHARNLPSCNGLLDGVLGVAPALPAAWGGMLPALDPWRRRVLAAPVEPPPGLTRRADRPAEIVLGCAGRVVREHKRLDRLPQFLRALDATGLRYRFEVLGDGKLRPELERRLSPRVRFHGWTSKEEYWRVLAGWDAMVFFSEVEGAPHALLEAMKLGVIPFFPRIGGSIGDLYAPQVDALCHYPAGDLGALAASVQRIFSYDAAKLAERRARACAVVAAHTLDGYNENFQEFIGQVVAQPRLSAPGDRARRKWSDGLPLGLVTRLTPWLLWQR